MSGTRPKRPLVAQRRRAAPTPQPKAPRKRRVPARKAAPKRGLLGWILWPFRFAIRVIWGIGWRLGLITALLIGAAVFYVSTTLPEIDELVDGRVRGSVTLLDRYGTEFAWHGEQFGGMITADQVSRHLRQAVVATEDKRFRLHPGVDPIGIASAIRINLREGRGPLSGHGGSTITQQTAKLLCLGVPYDPARWDSEAAYEADCRRSTLWRKGREAIYAMAMELKYSKDEILTIYLNRAYLGSGTRGFEAASQQYFGHSAAVVTPAEAAMLAGLLKAPSTYAPTRNLARAQNRAEVVIGLMQDQGYLTDAEATQARAQPAQLTADATANVGSYFSGWVMEQGPDFFTRTTTEDVIIQTTLDQHIQQAAEDALAWVFENRVRAGSEAQAAIVVMSADGAVRAMVGGRDLRATGQFNRATHALRQTGSAFKPFVYATAMEMGRDPMSLVVDEPTCWNVPGSGQWCPSNYSRNFAGPVTLTQALRDSLNIPAVKLSEETGRDLVRQVASQFGIRSTLSEGPALALGTSESTLIEMTGAYAGILNGGSAVTPYGLISLSLAGQDAPVMGSSGGIRERVIRQDVAQQLVWMMWQVVEQGTGRRAHIDGVEVAGKTGTTQSARDAWFIGFTGDYVAGVWMGYDDNRPLTGVTGGGLPAEIWRETMTRILDGRPSSPLPMLPPQRPAIVTQTAPSGAGGIAAPAPGAPGSATQQQPGGIEGLLRAILGGG